MGLMAGLGIGGKTAVAAGAGAGAAVLSVALWYGVVSPPGEEAAVMAVAVPGNGAPDAGAADAAPDEPGPRPPRFDTVRHAADGVTLIAGTGAPSSEVSIIVGGVEVAGTRTDAQGNFAVIVDLPQADAPRVVTLEMTVDGQAVGSEQSVILTPQADDPAVAQVAEGAADAPAEGEADAAAVEHAALQPEAAPPVLLADEEGLRVLNPAPAVGNVVIDTISYDAEGAVVLAGRATAPGHVRVYLDNRAILDIPADAQGAWRSVLPEVDRGIYTLRVDQIDAEGRVTSRFETPFQRDDPTMGAAGPVSGVQVQVLTVQPGFTLWGIASESYGDGFSYVRVYEANRDQIRNPDLIYPGQIFAIPD